MVGYTGRAVALTWAGAAIAGVREKGVTLNGEPIDVTSDEDSGWRTLLADVAEKSVNITLSGVTKSAVLRTAWFANDRVETAVITYPSGHGSFTGTFHLSSYSETGTYNDAATFECEIQSTGAVTYTPPV